MLNAFSKNLVTVWNANTSIFTVLIYILYFLVYRFGLDPMYAYGLVSLAAVNIVFVLLSLFMALKNRSEGEQVKKIVSLAIVRLATNGGLLFLLLQYL